MSVISDTSHFAFMQREDSRAAEEMQLLAEEKWIINALTKIKQQKHSLQIERLHLESMKSNLKSGTNRNVDKESSNEKPSTSIVNIMQNTSAMNSGANMEYDVPTANTLDERCNAEELNLSVTNPVFSCNIDGTNFAIEEEDDDDNVYIDINMLMNANSK